MKRFWLRLKEFFYSQLTDYAYCKYIGWRDKLVATQMQIKPDTWESLTPERKAKVEQELNRLADDLDQIEQNNKAAKGILDQLERSARGSRPKDHPWN